ncbi:MAG TPA: DedA family protein [Ignavibacteriaceae bacterium]|nr:DedA family protein [Ignavibacteriaceae bacterium]
MKEFLFNIITHYGYLGLFLSMALGIVGLPIPDETILAFSGFLVFQKELHLIPAMISAFAGSITGISISFILGRTLGIRILRKLKKWIHNYDSAIKKSHDYLEKYGGWIFIFGYFIPGIRHIVALVAGTTEIKYKKFALFAYIGALIWSSTFILLGFFLGKQWMKALEKIHGHIMLFSIILVALIVVIFLIRKFFWKKKTVEEPVNK